jgi:L-lysine exporter family protein LysE/ArgO
MLAGEEQEMLIPLGLLIGFLASLPPGPINLFALSQAVRYGFWKSLSVGLTAAIFDILYCYAALIGTSLLYSLLNRWSNWLRLASVIILAAVGWRLLRQARRTGPLPLTPPAEVPSARLVGLTSLLYISSPTLAAFWIAVAGAITVHGLTTRHGIGPVAFSVSCGIGSLTWYLGLARYAPKLRTAFSPRLFKIIMAALAIALLGLAALTFARFIIELW